MTPRQTTCSRWKSATQKLALLSEEFDEFPALPALTGTASRVAARIEDMLDDDDDLVGGALHLVGHNGVIDLLSSRLQGDSA